jgi:hypothetical protein
METSGASAGPATMAFPGLIEGGLAKEGCRGVNVILCGASPSAASSSLESPEAGRLVTTRAVNNIDQDVRLNKALWGLGERMARVLGRAA